MDTIIQKAAKTSGDRQLIDLSNGRRSENYYFFFKQELTNNQNPRRHMIPNKKKYFDYIEGKHYNTLEKWAQANGRTLDDIVYGEHRDTSQVWIGLDRLLSNLDSNWKWPEQVNPPAKTHDDIVKSIEDRLDIINSCMEQIKQLLTCV